MAQVIEHYLGVFWGGVLIRLTLICSLLGVIGLGLYWFFGNFVGEILWPFLTNLFGANQSGITLDNIEAIILVLVIAIVFLVIIFAVFAYVVARGFRRRVVPQASIDQLADHRSEGIHILNFVPEDRDNLDDAAQIAFVQAWRSRWNKWRDDVLSTLRSEFTHAETMSFQRLGLVPERTFGFAVNPEHNHCLMQLAKQLIILENMIEHHQERR